MINGRMAHGELLFLVICHIFELFSSLNMLLNGLTEVAHCAGR